RGRPRRTKHGLVDVSHLWHGRSQNTRFAAAESRWIASAQRHDRWKYSIQAEQLGHVRVRTVALPHARRHRGDGAAALYGAAAARVERYSLGGRHDFFILKFSLKFLERFLWRRMRR